MENNLMTERKRRSITPEEKERRTYSRGKKYNDLIRVLKENPGTHQLNKIHSFLPELKIGTLRQLLTELRELGYIAVVRLKGVRGKAFKYTLGPKGHAHTFSEERTYKGVIVDFKAIPRPVAVSDRTQLMLLAPEFFQSTIDHYFGSDIHYRRYWSRKYGGIPRKGVFTNYKS